jgi:hypothetical protein
MNCESILWVRRLEIAVYCFCLFFVRRGITLATAIAVSSFVILCPAVLLFTNHMHHDSRIHFETNVVNNLYQIANYS